MSEINLNRGLRDVRPKSLALSVDAIRKRIHKELLPTAIAVTREKLSAKQIKHFSHKGIVRDERIVDDHDIQLKAADQIYAMSGIYVRERDDVRSTPTVALEYDPKSGVMRLVIAGDAGEEAMLSCSEDITPIDTTQLALPLDHGRPPSDGKVSDKTWDILLDEEVE